MGRRLDRLDPVFVPPEGPPQSPPSREIYAMMGEENIFRLCANFYQKLEKSEIRPLFPPNMPEASKKLAAFLVGVLGGPPLYHDLYGPPRMRARHLPFPITMEARIIWLTCFKETLQASPSLYQFPKTHLIDFIRFLEDFSRWMVNKKS